MWTWPNHFLTTKRSYKETISNYEGLKPLPCPAAHSRIGHTREYHPPPPPPPEDIIHAPLADSIEKVSCCKENIFNPFIRLFSLFPVPYFSVRSSGSKTSRFGQPLGWVPNLLKSGGPLQTPTPGLSVHIKQRWPPEKIGDCEQFIFLKLLLLASVIRNTGM